MTNEASSEQNSVLAKYEFQFPDFKGLTGNPTAWLRFGQTTLLVGRNNVGKSAIIDAIRFAVDQKTQFNPEWNRHGGASARYRIREILGPRELRRVFPENTSGGAIPGSHWEFGKRFEGTSVIREFDSSRVARWIDGPDLSRLGGNAGAYQQDILAAMVAPDIKVAGIGAERNVQPESLDQPRPVDPSGNGLTNLVRTFLHNSAFRMSEVEVTLMSALNLIFQTESRFERILCRQQADGRWEIYLQMEGGEPVRLTQSGSSLKSIFIILATLHLNKFVDRDSIVEKRVFYVEEPENNLHPALLRRLLEYLHIYAGDNNISLIMTTHSSVAIDWASRKSGAYLYHVPRDNSRGCC